MPAAPVALQGGIDIGTPEVEGNWEVAGFEPSTTAPSTTLCKTGAEAHKPPGDERMPWDTYQQPSTGCRLTVNHEMWALNCWLLAVNRRRPPQIQFPA